MYTELEKIAHMQYFSFRAFVSGLHVNSTAGRGEDGEDVEDDSIKLLTVQYVVANAYTVSYPEAWPGTTICYTTGSLEPSDDDEWRHQHRRAMPPKLSGHRLRIWWRQASV